MNPYEERYKDLMVNMHDIHPTVKFGKNVLLGRYVIIGESCIIGDNVTIGHHSVILSDCIIGSRTIIDHHILFKEYTEIGEGCFIDSYVKSSGYNLIGNRVTLQFNATICREAMIEDDVLIGPNVMMIYKSYADKKRGETRIGARSHIGTNVVIEAGIKVCADCMVGAMSYITRNLKEPGIYYGVPAKWSKEWLDMSS